MAKRIKDAGAALENRPVALGELIHCYVRAAIETAVHEELAAALGAARYERNDARLGYRNGTKSRRLTGPTGPLELTLPRAVLHTAAGATEWTSTIVPRYQRRMREVNEAVVATYLAGGNARRIRGALPPLLKAAPLSKSAVSRIVATLKGALESPPGRLDNLKAEPRDVPARVCEALGPALADGVGGASRDDGDRRGDVFERERHGPRGDNDVHLETYHLGRETREALRFALAPARLGHEMLSIHVAKLAQSAQKRADRLAAGVGPDQIGGLGQMSQHADPIDLARGLRASDDGLREGAEGEADDDGTPVHQWIKLSLAAGAMPTAACRDIADPSLCGERPR